MIFLPAAEIRRLLAVVLLTGLVAAGITFSVVSTPEGANPLQLSMTNLSGQALLSITIEHGNANTQEKIQAFQLMPDEKRWLALNHEPGLGFNVDVLYASGKMVSACLGKFSEAMQIEVIITANGLDVLP